ncbi:V-type proton ATPase subunit E 1 [Thelohanellus kitauei]|uniref:V-type proton ATPase subunit E 1 n=1 Tax=Thelohanellus kitauei TaxID=669202 RepID=A0A0C2J2U1_THEKT|nr:V-type proton ATPase subunit E 1 [Thelohanellus kitauei]
MAISEEEVKNQMERLLRFIEQEANEKVQEIEAKAEEEFNIEKGKLVQSERLRIFEFYEKKEKQLTLLKKITQSQCLNASRIEVLKAQDDLISDVLKEAKNELFAFAETDQYHKLLSDVCLQSLLQIIEASVVVTCREKDVNLLIKLLPDIKASFEKMVGFAVDIQIDNRYLPDDSAGGVEVYTPDGRIRVNNTLDKILEHVSRQITPVLRVILFGENKNRRFKD